MTTLFLLLIKDKDNLLHTGNLKGPFNKLPQERGTKCSINSSIAGYLSNLVATAVSTKITHKNFSVISIKLGYISLFFVNYRHGVLMAKGH